MQISGLRARIASRSISSTVDAAVLDLAARHDLEPVDQRRGLGAAVGLDEAEHDVDAALAERVRLLEHPVGLADAGGEPDVELEPAAPGALHQLEEVLGARAGHGHLGIVAPSRGERARGGRTCDRARG